MRSSVSRRRLLQVAGIGGAAMVATACGTSSGGDSTEASAAEDMSDTEMVMNWSNWPLYIDTDDDTGEYPSLVAFQEATGIDVSYTEDINDNNEFFAKVRTQLEQGQDIGRDIVVLTDWMAALWIQSGYAQKLDLANIPNSVNLIPRLAQVAFDPDRNYSLPWQSGFAGLGYNIPALKEATGQDSMQSLDQLFDPALKGRITVLSEMRDTMGCIMGSLGYDAADFTDAQFEEAIAVLTKNVDSGQIRQVTGNDYIAAMDSGDVIAVIGWSGDVIALGEDFGFSLPESGGMLWTDNMVIPSLAQHKKNAEQVMNYYYDPEVAAQVAAWVNYLCPVEGAQAAMEKIDPELAASEWIFPSAAMLDSAKVFMELTPEKNEEYERLFQKAIGN
ncbi:MAG: spermidine/putrescine ABC transporter substrate-binding protein [Actinomycetia bacterium]|nr:spermidine/putrescine ABC transporter substrate-binding protein [Actinomycetes bacterium]MCH9737629.1 spermidine/putrescine ABC transporter substrate-binding protein [Actinomycetes bacterium]MCH9831680.1 spermidine/putrescine ABC transporter substrate-binding protein [Actinomycetes bacterium]MCH9841435.1 spermidine/putrescine ABC transporter substrate-binding protein [Actinomycetes bacterium]